MILRWTGIFAVSISLIACSPSKREAEPEELALGQSDSKADTLRGDANAIVIRLGISNDVMIEGKSIIVDSLPSELLRAQKIKGDSAVISVHMRTQTQYQLYADLQMILERNLFDKREAASLKKFDEHYVYLDKNKKAFIDSQHKLRILENRPH